MNFFNKKTYELDIPSHLIQSVRVYQCFMEAGLTISIDDSQVPTFQYLDQFFPVKYATNHKKAIKLNSSISHQQPLVRVGSHQQPLMYPVSILKLCKELWDKKRESKDIDHLFIGLQTPKRKRILQKWHNEHKGQKVVIKDSSNGRSFPAKAWDHSYYEQLSHAKFVLCPNGDFIWTYRFFETILCGAIPIVEDECDLYLGFHYFKMTDKTYKYDRQMAIDNYDKAYNILKPPKNLKQLAL